MYLIQDAHNHNKLFYCFNLEACAMIKLNVILAHYLWGIMFIKRDIAHTLKRYEAFPVIAVVGPRQSGKTTLVQHYFKRHVFLSLEKPSVREFVRTDPEGFLRAHENEHGIIIDEFQYEPELLSYIQLEVDAKNRPSYFVLTGSQNFLANQAVTQSLAGRVGVLTLLPCSINELKQSDVLEQWAQDFIFKGGYPRLYSTRVVAPDLYASYIHTYLEKDVRQLINVGDMNTFRQFLSLCAGRVGQILNMNELAAVCGISAPTAKRWMSVLQESYIIFLLSPYFKNFNKRLVKSPKLYFYDTGLACNLLRIESSHALNNSVFRGPLFENLIIGDLLKQYYNQGRRPALYFWRDANGRVEVDCIIEVGSGIVPVEVKASETIVTHFFDGLKRFNEISGVADEHNHIIYAGSENQTRKNGHIVSWRSCGALINSISPFKV
jgi:uncharacterized protein